MMQYRFTVLIFLFLVVVLRLQAQEPDDIRYRQYIEKHPIGQALNSYDAVYLMSIPELVVEPGALRDDLPAVVDNSILPYLRPVFNQEGPSCGQAAAIGYNFTYEMDHLRKLAADTSINQYPTHFTWNFMNGNGWQGVSYFHSFEIMRTCGCPNVEDYGGYYWNDGREWITGYEKYYNGMHNRINQVYSINTSTEAGILTLKNWVYNHLGASDEGGVASYYANVPWNAVLLNDTTPEGGKHVVTAWYPTATHAMTIVGFNDSIRWDYNEDGQYTNHLDINDDGIVDPKDWEIGGVRFVNSHGLNVQDSGFCYLMYKVLAEEFKDGGLWNQSVHILDIKDNYTPKLTLKVTLEHDTREMIRVRAGVSTDTIDIYPDRILDFPIFNFQGADHYMQGIDTAEYLRTIEFGLDITPLLSDVAPGQATKFFLLVDERDPFHRGNGNLVGCTLMDYNGIPMEISMDGLPVTLKENSLTIAAVIHHPDFDHPTIITEELPAFTAGEEYVVSLDVSGGSQPHLWSLQHHYLENIFQAAFPQVSEEPLNPDPWNAVITVPLDFSFPYFGRYYDTVYLNAYGFLQFIEEQLPWPYIEDEQLMLRSRMMVAPLSTRLMFVSLPDEDNAWYAGDENSATLRWKTSHVEDPENSEFNFAVKFYPSGKIEFYYGNCSWPESLDWVSGISNGNNKDFYASCLSGKQVIDSGKVAKFIPGSFPEGLAISKDGVLSGMPSNEEKIYNITVNVTDNDNISDTKTFQLSNGLLTGISFQAGGNQRVDYGDTVYLDIELKNIGNQTLTNGTFLLNIDDPFVNLVEQSASFGNILPGQTQTLSNALVFFVGYDTPDQYGLNFTTEIATDQQQWATDVFFTVNAPVLAVSFLEIIDEDDGILEPGETADVVISAKNNGHATAYHVFSQLTPESSDITINGSSVLYVGDLKKGQQGEYTFSITADDSIPNGTKATLLLDMAGDHGISVTNSFTFRIGRVPALVIDLDPNFHSGPGLYSTIEELGVIAEYMSFIPIDLDQYQSLFICLGIQYSNHKLTWGQGEQLESYLEAGGKIYMEGRLCWLEDPYTPVRSKFNISAVEEFIWYDTITGIPGTFTENMVFFNGAAYPVNFSYIEADGTAFPIMKDLEENSGLAIANDAGDYKTIGTIFEFGALQDTSHPSTKQELMKKILEFFDIKQYSIGIGEIYHPQSRGLDLLVYPNPAQSIINLQFTVYNLQFVVSIYDVYGRKIEEVLVPERQQKIQINVSDYPEGIYIAVLRNAQAIISSSKFIVASYVK